MIRIITIGFAVIGFLVLPDLSQAGGTTFKAKLSGDEEVSPVDTRARGNATLTVNNRGTKAKFRVNVRGAEAVVQAHLHCGRVGEDGPVVAFLFGSVPGGFDVNGRLAKFTMTDANIEAVASDCVPAVDTAIESIADLAAAMEEGLVYVNVHTIGNPGGEVRGQLGRTARSADGGSSGGGGGGY